MFVCREIGCPLNGVTPERQPRGRFPTPCRTKCLCVGKSVCREIGGGILPVPRRRRRACAGALPPQRPDSPGSCASSLAACTALPTNCRGGAGRGIGMAGLLDGIRVAEVAHPLTEYAGALMARLGAEVFLVEPPEGAQTRRRLPRAPGAGESTRGSLAFLARNAGKRSVVFNAASAGIAKRSGTCAMAPMCCSMPMVRRFMPPCGSRACR